MDGSFMAIVIIQFLVIGISAVVLFKLFTTRRISSSKSHLESTFDSIDDPLAIINSDYHILRVNKAYAALVHQTFQDVIGKVCYKVLRGRSVPCEDCRMRHVLSSGQRQYVQSSSHPLVPNERSISFTFYPFTQKRGNVSAVVEHIRDTTELELLKEHLEKQNRILSDTTIILRRTQREIDEELQMARLVQQSTLPQHIPEVPGIKMSVTYHPIEAVGGDVYDFIEFSKSRLGIFIGDASGHGMPSSLVSTISKMSLYNHSKNEIPTDTLLVHMNNDLIGNVRSGHYLTCFWGVFDTTDNTLIYSRAGHPMPIVIRANGDVIQLEAVGMFAGILDKPAYEQRKFHFRKGDRCYLFTDGIFEVVDPSNPKSVVLGFKKFATMLASVNQVPFDDIIPEIKNRLSAFTYDDDYTLIVFEVTEDRPQAIEANFPGFGCDDPIAYVTMNQLQESEDAFMTFYSTLEHCRYSQKDIQRIRLPLNELVSNAFIHGNEEDPKKTVTVGYAISDTAVRVCVVDEGAGFDIDAIPNPTRQEMLTREGGRGVYLMKKYVDAYGQNKKGNGVYFTINRTQVKR
jgi:sigma-B regulation protein RsbU (phosphoserine phosphatase)